MTSPLTAKVTTSKGMSLPDWAQASAGGALEAAAAGHLHAGDGDRGDVVGGDDGGELVGVGALVQLGAADDGDVAAHEALVEAGAGKRGAVGGDKQPAALVVGGLHRYEP